ncbi:hypothetical protein EVG20_g6993 [Dentipellis fragilis]|uniref:UBC core domain-containing protein n=1 Tax=Dentipellis fragilis TaxID=205917 RepID=A0A4Y9YJ23_9AGAM|nr:hypothetical protein EVG20_g6993 [Dentipellis fragilis]
MNSRGAGSSTALRRLMTEYKQLTSGGSPDGMFTAGPVSEADFFTWEALIVGPKDTPPRPHPRPPRAAAGAATAAQEGGVFAAKLTFVSAFPFPRTAPADCRLHSPQAAGRRISLYLCSISISDTERACVCVRALEPGAERREGHSERHLYARRCVRFILPVPLRHTSDLSCASIFYRPPSDRIPRQRQRHPPNTPRHATPVTPAHADRGAEPNLESGANIDCCKLYRDNRAYYSDAGLMDPSNSMPGDIEKQEPAAYDEDDSILDPAKESRRDAEYREQTGLLWSNYVKLAERRDKAVTTAWTNDMNGVVIFAGLYSAALTAFLVESYQSLQEDPADTSVVLLRQTVFLLAQISQQLSPIATIVQQWAGYRMQVFQKFDNPIECSRIRQYLYEGTARWNLNVVIETIPGLIHMALFLFFIGLADFLFSLDRVVASITSTLMLITVILYLGSTGLPLLSPQSPYQTPLSNILWWLSRKARTGDKGKSQLSTNMFDGRTQMAMEVSSGRAQRDARALRWFVTSPMDGAEFELFVNSISASVDSARGRQIWNRVARMHIPRERILTTGISGSFITHPVDDLTGRLGRFLQSCIGQSALDDATRQRRTRAGTNAVLSLMFAGGAKWDDVATGRWGLLLRSPTMARALVYLASVDTSGDNSFSDLDGTNAARRVCMSIITVSKTIAKQNAIRRRAGEALVIMDLIYDKQTSRSVQERFRDDMEALSSADSSLRKGLENTLILKFSQHRPSDTALLEKDVRAKLTYARGLLDHDPIAAYALLGDGIQTCMPYRPDLLDTIGPLTQNLIQHIPGSVVDTTDSTTHHRNMGLLLRHLFPPSMLARSVHLGVDQLQEYLNDTSQRQMPPKARIIPDSDYRDIGTWIPMQHALLLDLQEGGMVYGILLLVSTVQKTMPLTQEAEALYMKTFHVITSDWVKYKQSENTHLCLVDLLQILLELSRLPSTDTPTIPDTFLDALAVLMVNVLSGAESPHAVRARKILTIEVSLHPNRNRCLEECLQKLGGP